GALADLEDLGVAVVAGHAVLVHEAVAAVDPGGVAGVVHRRLGGDELGDGGLLGGILPRLHVPGGRAPGLAGGVGAGLHAGDFEAHRLVLADRLAEGRALLGVAHALVHAALRRTGGQRGDRDAALVQDG